MWLDVIAATTSKLLPSGPLYNAHARRILNNRSFDEDDTFQLAEFLANGGGITEEEDDADAGLGEETETRELLLLDAKAWKVSSALLTFFRVNFFLKFGRLIMWRIWF